MRNNKQTAQENAPRNAFLSRTLPGRKTEYRSAHVTKHQVTGWRFLLARIASGVALHDTRMLSRPLRTQFRSLGVGAMAAITIGVGCLFFSFLRPAGSVREHSLLADKDTAALYVKLGDVLHPVLNVPSAHLILGKHDPVEHVKSSLLDSMKRGITLGIPGAPNKITQEKDPRTEWALCDVAQGENDSLSAIISPHIVSHDPTGVKAQPLAADKGILVESNHKFWLLHDGVKSQVDLRDRVVTDALGIGAISHQVQAPRHINTAFLNTIPETRPITVPVVAHHGHKPRYKVPLGVSIGSLIRTPKNLSDVDNQAVSNNEWYLVLEDGVAHVPSTLASAIHNRGFGHKTNPIVMSRGDIAQLPISTSVDTSMYPPTALTMVDASAEPTVCLHWYKAKSEAQTELQLLSGLEVPAQESLTKLHITSDKDSAVANDVYVKSGAGYLVQITGEQPDSHTTEAMFWISDNGVRYGLDTEGRRNKTLSSLGLEEPGFAIPWSIARVFPGGPTLSQENALTPHIGGKDINSINYKHH